MSINLVITHPDLVRETLTGLTGHALDERSTLAEMLRHELSARGVSSRRTVCDSTEAQLAAFASWPREEIRKTLDELERSGDVSSAPGGRVAPAPLRLVDLDGKRFVVFGGMPSSTLRCEFSAAEVTTEETQRWMVFADVPGGEFTEQVARLGGLILSPTRWAGMDRVPACGPEWLVDLEQLLELNPVRPSAWDFESMDEWSVYVPDPSVPAQRFRWCRSAKGATGQLWRSRHRLGWWAYAWTEGASPKDGNSLKLRQDDAMRAAFSLDSVSGAPLAFQFSKGSEVELLVDAFLPLAEYRFLNVSGRQSRDEKGGFRYRFELDAWERLTPSLLQRLHVELKEVIP